jgi:polar amino acid transport system permease protein
MHYRWDFGLFWQYYDVFLQGLLLSIAYTIGTTIAGLALGLACGLARRSRYRVVTVPVQAYIEAFRCTPLLVQLIWFYYALPVILNVQIPAPVAASLALTLYAGSFYAEIFRAGIQSIDRGQWDAARALGMRRGRLMRRVILPQAIKRMIPPMLSQTLMQLKNTSLISTMAVGELLYQGTVITAATYRPLEVYTIIAVIYFAVLFPLTMVTQRLETRLAVSD